MTKYLVTTVLVVATVLVAVKELSVPPSGVAVDVFDVMAQEFHIKERLENQRQFRLVFDSTLVNLAKGDIHLKAAALRVSDAGEAFCPLFIKHVSNSEPTGSLTVSVARNLIGHLRIRAEARPCLCSHITQLEAELQALIAEAKQGTQSPTETNDDVKGSVVGQVRS